MRLPYPRLYLRMALHIGAALAAFVLIGAASLAVMVTWELTNYIETRHSELGREAARILATQDSDGLREWLSDDADIPDNVSLYILDEYGNDILQRPIPDIYKSFVQTSVIGTPEPAGSNFLPVRLAPRIIDSSGNSFTFLVVPKDIAVWGSLATGIGLLVVALLVIATVAWLIARAFGRPIGELQSAVRNLAAGDISARVPASIATRRDELGQLAEDFNTMAEKLDRMIEGREELLREMSHELRSPLTRLQAALALAAVRSRLEPAEHARIEQEISRMNQVIGEILRYSSLNAAVHIQNRLVRIDQILTRLQKIEEIEAASHDCNLTLDVESDLVVVGDPELLRSAFENIIRNAIRFTPAGSDVEIKAWRDKSEPPYIIVNISDRGLGIPQDQLIRVFEPYVRINSSGNSEGTGLGLAIVKRVVETHSGKVRASRRSGGGLTMQISIPAADLH